MFYPLYILMDIPWVIAVKRFGVNRVLAFAMVGWTASTIGMGFCQTYAQAIGCRLVLGGFEAGLIPACVFIISTIVSSSTIPLFRTDIIVTVRPQLTGKAHRSHLYRFRVLWSIRWPDSLLDAARWRPARHRSLAMAVHH